MKFTLVEEAIISVCKYETLTVIYFRRGMQLLCSILGANYSAVVSFFNFIAASRGGWGLFGSHTASTLNPLSPRHPPPSLFLHIIATHRGCHHIFLRVTTPVKP